ncbi:MAG TPA: amino acid dehydrogenase [Nevskiaceae bacterium]|nr:amino acid dehydrogenase [Nevskiaceae bacterium]
MFDHPAFDAHERVTFFSDAATGLRGIVAVHSTKLGPGMGGCRAWRYADTAAALTDALRLSRGMSYKNAVAGLPLGGAKAVILKEGAAPLSEAQLEAFGAVVQGLGGAYVTAEDVGISERDMLAVARRTTFVSGITQPHAAGFGGDPSPKTALGVFLGMRSAVRARLGRTDLAGLKVAVQGLGNVGLHLCDHLHRAGAKLVVADLNAAAVEMACTRFGATAVSVGEILFQDVDVLAPCALGAIFDETSIRRIRAHVIAGAANNQLRTDTDGRRLHDVGILYAPDYVINAGGIIAAGLQYLKETDAAHVNARIAGIERTLDDLFARSIATNTPTNVIADAMARERLAAGPRPDGGMRIAA